MLKNVSNLKPGVDGLFPHREGFIHRYWPRQLWSCRLIVRLRLRDNLLFGKHVEKCCRVDIDVRIDEKLDAGFRSGWRYVCRVPIIRRVSDFIITVRIGIFTICFVATLELFEGVLTDLPKFDCRSISRSFRLSTILYMNQINTIIYWNQVRNLPLHVLHTIDPLESCPQDFLPAGYHDMVN